MTRLSELLEVLLAQHAVPGAQLAVRTPAGVDAAAGGVVNVETGVETTTDAVFQIGSITKVWTATLLMQLVEDELVDLDQPVVRYLPMFTTVEETVSAAVTVRQLLCHSSGIDGDLFLDTGRGDDAVDRYVAAMADLGFLHPPGTAMSYCNAGYTLLGHLIAQLRGACWEQVVHDRIVKPLGLATAGTLPEDALRHRAAYGHTSGADERPTLTSVWAPHRSAGPAGLVHCSATDLLRFTEAHLYGGECNEGSRLLSPTSAAAMQEPQIRVADPDGPRHWGLGWFVTTWDDVPVIGHDGGTIGQYAFLRAFPGTGTAIALLTNGGSAAAMFRDALDELAPDLCGAAPPERTVVPITSQAPPTAAAWVGRYRREGQLTDVSLRDGQLRLSVTSFGGLTELQESKPLELAAQHVRADLYAVQLADGQPSVTLGFDTLADGAAAFHVGSRMSRRTEP